MYIYVIIRLGDDMKKFFKFLFILFFVLILTSCGKKGEEKEIILLGNDNSYYNWTYTIADESVISIVDEKYYGEENSDEIEGLGGEYHFTIKSLKAGKTTINFSFVKSWDETDELYNYYVDVLVNDDLEIEITKELGNYLSLMKFIKIDREILGLDKSFDEYMLYFSDDPVDYGEYECMRLSVYDYEGNPVAYYAISNSNNYVFKVIDEEYILLNED